MLTFFYPREERLNKKRTVFLTDSGVPFLSTKRVADPEPV